MALEIVMRGTMANSRTKEIRVTIPWMNVSNSSTRDERGFSGDDRRKWSKRIAFGAFDTPTARQEMSNLFFEIPLSWHNETLTGVEIYDDEDMTDPIVKWENVELHIAARWFGGQIHFFYELQTQYFQKFSTYDAKDVR